MGLSWQQGPLAPGAIGRFLVPEPLPERLLYIEPLRRRMRVRFGGAWIADSENATSASWPTANVPPPCHFAFSCSAWRHEPRQRYPPPVRAMLGFAPNVVGRCWLSKGLQLRRSNSVLRQVGTRSPHESAQHRARARILPARASDTALSTSHPVGVVM